ncbi:hypothetical protein JCGZ_13492 [Jatropha curcas]|uniref:Secreted protein n=1 Tax=Jatropha curcas TaxID=180498 RepID=A0A067LC30_JATCU|nr:hypothetical protein JCGZ_13492 [Jatropha curcas]
MHPSLLSSVSKAGWILMLSKLAAATIVDRRFRERTMGSVSTRHSTLVESEPTTTALRSNSGAAAGRQLPYTDIDSFFVPGPTSQPFAGWSEVSLVWENGIGQSKEKRVLDRNNGQQRPSLHR